MKSSHKHISQIEVSNENNNGNWVSKKLLLINGIIAIVLVLLSVIITVSSVIGVIIILLAILFSLSFAYFSYAHYKLSPKGGNIQNKVYDLLLNYVIFQGHGKIIDIGCGNASLTIKLAKKYPDAFLTGIDFWKGMWDYSKETCENHAQIEGVKNRINFIQASASSLPFDDKTFDLAVSNFVFHEVKDVKNKKDVIKESLRMVKKGGIFIFQDLFLSKYFYGKLNILLDEIKSWGINDVRFINTSKADFIPRGLKLSFMLGNIGIIYGTK